MNYNYEVELETEQELEESFWMYRLFDTEKEAVEAASLLSSFFPSASYPTKITIKKHELHELTLENGEIIKDIMRNTETLKTLHLKNEDGEIV